MLINCSYIGTEKRFNASFCYVKVKVNLTWFACLSFKLGVLLYIECGNNTFIAEVWIIYLKFKHNILYRIYIPFSVNYRIVNEHACSIFPRAKFFCFFPSITSVKYISHMLIDLTRKGLMSSKVFQRNKVNTRVDRKKYTYTVM